MSTKKGKPSPTLCLSLSSSISLTLSQYIITPPVCTPFYLHITFASLTVFANQFSLSVGYGCDIPEGSNLLLFFFFYETLITCHNNLKVTTLCVRKSSKVSFSPEHLFITAYPFFPILFFLSVYCFIYSPLLIIVCANISSFFAIINFIFFFLMIYVNLFSFFRLFYSYFNTMILLLLCSTFLLFLFTIS